MARLKRPTSQSGQAVVEYILMIAFAVSLTTYVIKMIKDYEWNVALFKPIQTDFARAYQYGHPKAKGWDEGSEPDYHPRATVPEGRNFRIFHYYGGQ